MKIRVLDLKEEDLKKDGLKPFFSNKIADTIAFVGRNGSGKTRYLNAIYQKLSKPDFTDILLNYYDTTNKDVKRQAETLKPILKLSLLKSDLERINQLATVNTDSKELQDQKRELQNSYKLELLQVKNAQNLLDGVPRVNAFLAKHFTARLKVIKPNDLKSLKSSIEKNRPDQMNFQNVVDAIEKNLEVDEISMISESAIGFLQSLPLMLQRDEYESKGDLSKFHDGTAYKRFLILSELIQTLLGKKLTFFGHSSGSEIIGDKMNVQYSAGWKMDDLDFNYSKLSEGEKVLFTYAILFFLLSENPNVKFSESIVLIDEPEIHLHPKAQVDLIKNLQEILKTNGQLIIATHSLSIIANLDYESIFLVQDNQMNSPRSSIPYSSIEQLMGFDEHYCKIVEFLVSTPNWAMTNFMSQCFEDPKVFDFADHSDPQIQLFKDLLTKGTNLNILDFGCGSGRLLRQINETPEIWSRIEKYDCFDIEQNFRDKVITHGAKNFFHDLKEISQNQYDIVVIVNVLHEIPIHAWESSLNVLRKSLKQDGFLVIIEDTQLPVGELPNDHGFLLLDKEELKMLLGDETRFLSPQNARYKDRIVCAFIAKTEMRNIQNDLLIKTLELLKTNSLKSIVKYRKVKTKEVSLGRMYALKANLYLNCTLAIGKLNGEELDEN